MRGGCAAGESVVPHRLAGIVGGNMDYNGLRLVTVHLPVYVAGALFVGDGHAAEGDGELNGDALETSMDVEFTVNPSGPQHGRRAWRMNGYGGDRELIA
jgi:acetamidase/formamidase